MVNSWSRKLPFFDPAETVSDPQILQSLNPVHLHRFPNRYRSSFARWPSAQCVFTRGDVDGMVFAARAFVKGCELVRPS